MKTTIAILILAPAFLWTSHATSEQPPKPVNAHYDLRFEFVDARTGQPVPDAVVLTKEDEKDWVSEEPYDTASWEPYSALAGGRSIFQRRTPATAGQAHVLVLASGYEPAQLKLNESLQPGTTFVKLVELTPLPSVGLTIVAPAGQPAAGAAVVLRAVPPEKFRRTFYNWDRSTLERIFGMEGVADARGLLRARHPALADWSAYRIMHASGYAEFDAVPAESSPSTGPRIQLVPYATIRCVYLPAIAANEFLEVYRLKPNRMSVDGPAVVVELDEEKRFQLERRLAGWHSLVHRVRYADADGRENTSAAAVYGPFAVAAGETADWTLGDPGRPVLGRLAPPAERGLAGRVFRVSVDSADSPSRPKPPADFADERALQAWWDAYWESEAGRRYSDASSRYASTATDADGRFRFPLLRPGRYVLRLSQSNNDPQALALQAIPFEVPQGPGTDPIDLGSLSLNY